MFKKIKMKMIVTVSCPIMLWPKFLLELFKSDRSSNLAVYSRLEGFVIGCKIMPNNFVVAGLFSDLLLKLEYFVGLESVSLNP